MVHKACQCDPPDRRACDQGDAYRALRSLVDAAGEDRLVAEPAEIMARVREVVTARSHAS